MNGPIVAGSNLMLTSSGTDWDANSAPLAVLVPGLRANATVNNHTDKIQNVDIHDMDFFPVTTFWGLTESAASDLHLVQTAQMPDRAPWRSLEARWYACRACAATVS